MIKDTEKMNNPKSAQIVYGVFISILILTSFIPYEPPTPTIEKAEFKVIDASWGHPENKIEVAPGDVAVPLYVIIQNVMKVPVSGVVAYLHLQPPFYNVTGGNVTVAYYGPINSGGVGILIFTLNIDNEADLKVYKLKLDVQCLINGIILECENLTVSIPLLGRSELDVSIDQVLVGGEAKDVTIEVCNKGTTHANQVNIVLEAASPLFVLGNNRWQIQSIAPGETVKLNTQMFAPKVAIGNVLQGLLSITYKNTFGSIVVEQIPLSFLVKGKVKIDIISEAVTPNPASPGDYITISASLINIGTVAGENAIIYLNLTDPFLKTPDSTRYIGKVDPEAPIPFTLACTIGSQAKEGAYQIKMILKYNDEFGNEVTKYSTIQVTITKEVEEEQQITPWYAIEFLEAPLYYWALLVALCVALLLSLIRRK